MTDEKKFEVHAEITARLTQQDVDDIMVSALESGINYWCRRVVVQGKYLGSTQATRFLAVGSLPFGSKSRLRMTRLVICSISTSSSLDLSSGSKIATPTSMLWTVQMAPLTAARLMPSVQTRLSSTHCSAIWYSAEGGKMMMAWLIVVDQWLEAATNILCAPPFGHSPGRWLLYGWQDSFWGRRW